MYDDEYEYLLIIKLISENFTCWGWPEDGPTISLEQLCDGVNDCKGCDEESYECNPSVLDNFFDRFFSGDDSYSSGDEDSNEVMSEYF